jgi:hypothetical protein
MPAAGRNLNQIYRTEAGTVLEPGHGGRCGMQHHWLDIDEQPTPMATLTIVKVPLLPDDPADDEQPTPMAILTIEMVPALLPGEGVEGTIPSYGFRPDPDEFAAASEHLEARGRTTDAYLHACIRWLARDPDTALAALADWPRPRPAGDQKFVHAARTFDPRRATANGSSRGYSTH